MAAHIYAAQASAARGAAGSAARREIGHPPAGRERYRALRSGECPLSPTPWRSPPTSRPRAAPTGGRWSRRCWPSPAARPTRTRSRTRWRTRPTTASASPRSTPPTTRTTSTPTAGPGTRRSCAARPRDGATVSGWDVRTRHADADAARVNAAVLQDLETRRDVDVARASATAALDVADLGAALDGVYLDLAPVVLDAGAHVRAKHCRLCSPWLSSAASTRRELRGSLGADPIGARARTGADGRPRPAAHPGRAEQGGTEAAPGHRRRHRLPRRRRLRRAGARPRHRGRRRLPARAHRRRPVGRRGAGRARVPLGRHGRAVPVHRQAARRPPRSGTASPSCAARPTRGAASTSTPSPRPRC